MVFQAVSTSKNVGKVGVWTVLSSRALDTMMMDDG